MTRKIIKSALSVGLVLWFASLTPFERSSPVLADVGQSTPTFSQVPNAPVTVEQGITLRDWFAGQCAGGGGASVNWSTRGLADRCYEVADAMIQRRQRQ
jgi:hypothetical protein